MNTEGVIQNLIYSKDINKINFSKINYDELIKVGSKHLILPLIYTSLKKNKKLNETPQEFQNYLKYIYAINYNRNEKLINEAKIISKILNENNIKHFFLKGTAGLISNIYENIGDRMVGDIDILVLKSQIDKAHKLMIKDGYKPLVDKIFFKKYNRHLVRQVNPKKLFAIELHEKLLKFEIKNCNEAEFFKNIKQIDGISVPSEIMQLIHNIYNFQINDDGFAFQNHSYKNIYDSNILLKKIQKKELKFIKKDKYLMEYLFVGNNYGLTEFIEGLSYINICSKFRFKLRYKSLLFRKFDSFLTKFIINAFWIPTKLIEFIKNPEYRSYVINKLLR